MGFLGSVLGTNSSYNATPADIQNGTSAGQLDNSYNQVQNNMGQQQAFTDAVGKQNGLGNQSNVFNQMQGLSGQLQGVADGTGPNPAMAQLNQQTGNNVASQAAMMAGQRGSGANAGMMARQAAMQGANTQQQGVGQAATLQANQSLGAMGQMQQQQANMANLAGNQVAQHAGALQSLNQTSQNNHANLLTAQGTYNNAVTSGKNAANALNQDTDKQNASNNASMIGGLMSSGSAAMSKMAHGGYVQHLDDGGSVAVQAGAAPAAGPGPSADVPNEWASLANMVPSMGGGGGGGGGGMGALMMLAAHGGMIPKYADGGNVPIGNAPQQVVQSGPQSRVGKFLKGAGAAMSPQGSPGAPGGMTGQQQLAQGMKDMGGSIGSLFASKPIEATPAPNQSPGSTDLPQQQAPTSGATGMPEGGQMYAAWGGQAPLNGEAYAQTGMKVPGQASVQGDSYSNDTVDAKLSPGEIIVDREHSSDPMKAAQFAYAVALKNQRRGRR